MKMTIGTKIQTLRKQRGLSQEQLAEALGVSRQAVSKWEAEQSVPDIDKIILICDYFDVTTDYILRNAESPKPEQESETQRDTIIQNTHNISENEVSLESEEKKKKSALLLSVAIMLYILCIVPIIIIQNEVGIVLMLVMVAGATGMIIFRSKLNSSNKSDENEEEPTKPENPILKAVKSCVWAVAVIIYFVISFSSGAWYITWLVFPITGAITDVIKACFDLKDGDNK